MKILKALKTTVPITKLTIIVMLGGTTLIGFLFGIIYKETANYNQEQNSYISVIKNSVMKKPTAPAINTVTPSSMDETANWKTYTNAKLGFELKYPSAYKITEQSQNKILVVNATDVFDAFWISSAKDKSFININTLKTCKTVYEEYKQNPSMTGGPICIDERGNFGIVGKEPVTKLGNNDAKEFYVTFTGQGSVATTRIIQTINPPFIQISSIGKNTDQILSTFKFTN